MLTAALIGIGSVVVGLLVSFHADTSASATVSVIPIVAFFVVLTAQSVAWACVSAPDPEGLRLTTA